MTEKLIRDGKVAVLYSSGYGGEWSTQEITDAIREIVLFHPDLVRIVLGESGADFETTLQSLLANVEGEFTVYCVPDVEWLPVGSDFMITEEDGKETIHCKDDIKWITA